MKTTLNKLMAAGNAIVSFAEGRRLSSLQAIKLNGVVKKADEEIEVNIGDVVTIGKKKTIEVTEDLLRRLS